MCKTRCYERDVPYEHFYLAFPFNVETLEIVNGTNRSINMFDERPKVGTRIQGKKQRLISMPLQALSSQLVSHLFIDFCILLQVQHKSFKTVLLIQSRHQEVQFCILDTRHASGARQNSRRVVGHLQTSRKNRLKYWCFTIHTKDCFKTNELKQYSCQHTRGVLQKSIGYTSFKYLHRRNGVPL